MVLTTWITTKKVHSPQALLNTVYSTRMYIQLSVSLIKQIGIHILTILYFSETPGIEPETSVLRTVDKPPLYHLNHNGFYVMDISSFI